MAFWKEDVKGKVEDQGTSWQEEAGLSLIRSGPRRSIASESAHIPRERRGALEGCVH